MEKTLVEKPRTRSFWPSMFGSDRLEKFFNSDFGEMFPFERTMNIPAVNVSETEKEFKLTLAAPGMEKIDFHVEADDELMTISAKKEKEEKEEKDGRFTRREYNFNSWSRTFNLPENCDPSKISAEYKNGELFIMIPKTKSEYVSKFRNISVK
jgi:HSP20 family protein